MHKPQGLSSGFLPAVHLVTLHEKLQTLSSGYLSASLGVRLQFYREVFFYFFRHKCPSLSWMPRVSLLQLLAS